jgi:hypothetical protein
MNIRKTSPFLLLASALSISAAAGMVSSITACGGSGGGGGAGGGGTGGGASAACFDYAGYDGTTPAVHFQADVLPIFRLSCGLSSSCHGNQAGSGGQHFYGPKTSDPAPDAAALQAIFDQSLGQPAVANPDMNIITAGDPSKSFLMYKLDGDPSAADATAQVSCANLTCAADGSCLSSMPQGGPALPAAKRDIVRAWIKQGAKND